MTDTNFFSDIFWEPEPESEQDHLASAEHQNILGVYPYNDSASTEAVGTNNGLPSEWLSKANISSMVNAELTIASVNIEQELAEAIRNSDPFEIQESSTLIVPPTRSDSYVPKEYSRNDVNSSARLNVQLSDYESYPLNNYQMYSNENTTIRNLRVIQEPKSLFISPELPVLSQINSLYQFRVLNNFTLEDCLRDASDDGTIGYSVGEGSDNDSEHGRFPYAPQIRRTLQVVERGRLKTITEGLCPYCSQIKFLQLKNSNYGHHLCIQHGIQTNGLPIPDPENHCFYYYEKKNKINWTNQIFDGVSCPVEGCHTICKVSPSTSPNPNRLLDYLRHYKKSHKSGRLLDAMRR